MQTRLLLTLMVAAVAFAPASAGAATRDCREVWFTHGSEDIAGGIRVEGVSCRTARRFIRAVDGNAPKRFRGYRCTRKDLDTALPSRRYRCTNGGKLIRWVKT